MPARRGMLRALAAAALALSLAGGAVLDGFAQQSTGGYSRPSVTRGGGGASGGGDTAFSRGAASEALQRYRASREPPRRPPVAAPGTSGWADQRRPSPYYAPQYGGGGGGGDFGTMALWALLGALSASDRAKYAREHQDDPAYLQWRAQAQQQAARDPAIAQQLQQMDPAAAARPPPQGGMGGIGWLVVFAAGAGLVLLWRARRYAARAPPVGLRGSASTRWRVGMTLPLDPTPFLLAAGATHVQPPPGEGGMISVEAVGLLADAAAQLHRLYLPGRAQFFQIHLGPRGTADECRYFSRLDEVTPASEADWAAWLDPAQGMIGWPAFQTKDGKIYGRAWAPGAARIPPRQMQETVESPQGTVQRQLQAMLYAAPTGAAAPAPPTEYIMVAAIEAEGQAWVEIHAGIDINPAALELAPVPLEPQGRAA